MDARYHGGRAPHGQAYADALVRAWRAGRAGQEHERPLLLDTVWDVSRLLDYLETRDDVDARRMGATGAAVRENRVPGVHAMGRFEPSHTAPLSFLTAGISLGGMISWLSAASDERIACAAPLIGVQGFRWATEHDRWQARASSISAPFVAAAAEVGLAVRGGARSDADEVAKAIGQLSGQQARDVLEQLAPGITTAFDSPASLPLVAPRPFLALNGELDPRCPPEGTRECAAAADAAYAGLGFPPGERFRIEFAPGVGHEATPPMLAAAGAWLDHWILFGGAESHARMPHVVERTGE